MDNLKDVEARLATNPRFRRGLKEARLRGYIADCLRSRVAALNLSQGQLARRMGTSVPQVRRILHEDIGAGVTLMTLVSAADALDADVSVHIRPRVAASGKLVNLGERRWAHQPPAVKWATPESDQCEVAADVAQACA